ncbi:MAG: hypothetical protein ACRDU5_09460 [Mycobacterium sp.]
MLSALVAATTVATFAGCSSDTAPSQQTPPPAEAPRHGTYAGCLARHDVPTPPPGPGGPPPGVDQATWEKAVQACASLAPGPVS